MSKRLPTATTSKIRKRWPCKAALRKSSGSVDLHGIPTFSRSTVSDRLLKIWQSDLVLAPVVYR